MYNLCSLAQRFGDNYGTLKYVERLTINNNNNILHVIIVYEIVFNFSSHPTLTAVFYHEHKIFRRITNPDRYKTVLYNLYVPNYRDNNEKNML